MPRLLILSLLVLFLQSPQSSAEKPNILWVFIEDMSPWIGCYGDKINADKTPNIDSLAARLSC